jgi:hypothetical protein
MQRETDIGTPFKIEASWSWGLGGRWDSMGRRGCGKPLESAWGDADIRWPSSFPKDRWQRRNAKKKNATRLSLKMLSSYRSTGTEALILTAMLT